MNSSINSDRNNLSENLQEQIVATSNISITDTPVFLNGIKTNNLYSDSYSLEYPCFALKNSSKKTITFEEIWMYILTKYIEYYKRSRELSNQIFFTYHDCLKFLSPHAKKFSKRDYQRVETALDRLKATTIKIIEYSKDQVITHSFSFISNWSSTKELKYLNLNKDYIRVVMDDYILRTVIFENKYFKIDPRFLDIKSSLDRRLHEIGIRRTNNKVWSNNDVDLHQKVGSTALLRKFNYEMNTKIANSEVFLGITYSFDPFRNVYSAYKIKEHKDPIFPAITVNELLTMRIISPLLTPYEIEDAVKDKYYVIDLYDAQTDRHIKDQKYPTPEEIIKHYDGTPKLEYDGTEESKNIRARKLKALAEANTAEKIAAKRKANKTKPPKINVRSKNNSDKPELIDNAISFEDENKVFEFEYQEDTVEVYLDEVFEKYEAPLADPSVIQMLNPISLNSTNTFSICRWYQAFKDANYVIVNDEGVVVPPQVFINAYIIYCSAIVGANAQEYLS